MFLWDLSGYSPLSTNPVGTDEVGDDRVDVYDRLTLLNTLDLGFGGEGRV